MTHVPLRQPRWCDQGRPLHLSSWSLPLWSRPMLGTSVRAGTAPPLLADWRPRIGPGTLPSLALAALACSPALHRACGRLGWRRLLGAAWLLGVAWLLSLALVDGPGEIRPLDQSTEYLPTARAVENVPETLRGFVDRIPFDHPDHWAVHVAGHPPGALLLFVALARVGLASGPAAGLVVVAVAATTPLAVAVALRALGAEHAARIALPFLVIGPAAIWQAVSADAVFAAVGAWGTAALATSTVGHRHAGPWRAAAWAALAGVLFGACIFLSYGLLLLPLLALGILWASRRWLPLVVAIPAALAVAVAFATAGFAWWEAFPVLRQRYADGIASQRPAAYWLWATSLRSRSAPDRSSSARSRRCSPASTSGLSDEDACCRSCSGGPTSRCRSWWSPQWRWSPWPTSR